MVVLWNPSIRKSVGIDLGDVLRNGLISVGFGVCPKTSDPKVIKIRYIKDVSDINSGRWDVEVFSLSSRAWRSISINMSLKEFSLISTLVTINGVIYWTAYDRINTEQRGLKLIITFDLASEEFGKVYLPERLANCLYLDLCKLKESLCVLEFYAEVGTTPICAVWLMKDSGVTKSFTKLYSIKGAWGPYNSIYNDVIEFRKNGKPIVRTNDKSGESTLRLYEPCSQHFSDLGFVGVFESLSVMSYTETLLLLDQLDSIRGSGR